MSVRLTLPDIPKPLDEALRRRAQFEGKTIEQVAVDAMAAGMGISNTPSLPRDLSDVAGTWVEDPAFDEAVRSQDQVDPEPSK